VDSKAECDQLNLAHETKTKNASAHLVHWALAIREGSPRLMMMTEKQCRWINRQATSI